MKEQKENYYKEIINEYLYLERLPYVYDSDSLYKTPSESIDFDKEDKLREELDENLKNLTSIELYLLFRSDILGIKARREFVRRELEKKGIFIWYI